ncbi:MAG: helix-turn-helix domain-containing protein, partial [Candidatus Levybacteria bacterium]|nr:helix-turn-helix domain-containing protein [Candidatus Levybacteria bacterium]
MKNRLYTIQEVADILGVSTKTLRRWDQRGSFIATRTAGNQRRYTQEQISNFKSQNSPARNATQSVAGGKVKISARVRASIPQGEPFFKPETPKEFKPAQGLPSALRGLPSNSFLKSHFLLRGKVGYQTEPDLGKLAGSSFPSESEVMFVAQEDSSKGSESPVKGVSAESNSARAFKIGMIFTGLVLILSFVGAVAMTRYDLVAGFAQRKEQFAKLITNLPQVNFSIKPKDLSFAPQNNQAVLAAATGDSDLILNVNVPSFFSQSVGIGTTTINPAAILDIVSEDKGFLAPRMTEDQMNAIPVPPAGLFVYNTDTNHYNMYNGTAWQGVFTAIGDSTTGEAFTEEGTSGTALYFYDADGRGKLTTADLSSARIYTLPDATGTIVTTGNLTAITAVGTVTSGVWNGTTI